tara:strand:+ start:17201 stop:17695 length:495 start_codon:yes stop_codon:yes gene_type:complete
VINNLIKLSNHLDAKGLRKEADYLDAVIRKVAHKDEVMHFVEESYPIGDGTYCQLKLSTGEHYIFQCIDLPDFTPGAAVSDDEVNEASELLQGDGSYKIPDDFLRENGLALKEVAKGSDIPEGAELTAWAHDSEGTRCYYKLNSEILTISSDRKMDCAELRSAQ